MKLLALDTATDACSAAVLVDGQIYERFEWAPRRQAELILPLIEAVLAEASLGPRQLDALAFGRGPGAFTGLRIAAGVVQGIAFASDRPVVPISTLATIARQVYRRYGAEHIAVALDARMGEVYWGAYQADADGDLVLCGDERVAAATTVTLPVGGNWQGAGSGWEVYGEALGRRLDVTTWWSDCPPRAGDIAWLAARAWQRGETVSAEQALPVYLRDEVAVKPGH
jgi:tRNA threonylcarbamoyladenosine biosynthesis protein TsaB